MPYEDKIMVASGDSEHPGTEEVGFETIPRRGGEGHTYDLEFNDGLDELTLTEDSSDKTTLPLAATFVGTTAEWEALSAAEKANYRLVHFTEDGGIGDASDAVVAFTSSDVVDGNANDWTSVTPITTGLNLKTLWGRASMMFKNIRYLYKMLGTTDISLIGDGTVTGGIDTLKNTLNGKVNVTDFAEYKESYQYGYSKSLHSSIYQAIESSFQAANNYSLFQGATANASEGGWYGFKHTTAKQCSMIYIDRNGIAIVYRSTSGQYSSRYILFIS